MKKKKKEKIPTFPILPKITVSPMAEIGIDTSVYMDYMKIRVKNYIYDIQERKFEEQLKTYAQARKNPSLNRFLHWLYLEYSNNNLLEVYGKKFPVAVYSASNEETCNYSSLLKLKSPDIDDAIDPILKSAGDALIKHMENSNINFTDDPTYTVQNIKIENGLEIVTGRGKYADAIKSCDVLEYEILNEIGEKELATDDDFQDFFNQLPLRQHVHKLGDPLFESNGRSVALGISTPIIYLDQDGNYYMMLMKRSNKVATHKNLFHVIPSAMFQPINEGWFEEEHDIKHNFKKEYLEEVFDRKDLTNINKVREGGTNPIDHTFFYESDDNLRYINHLLKNDRAKLLFTGITINLQNLRPEICTLLLITDAKWFEHQKQGKNIFDFSLDAINFNWEADNFTPIENIVDKKLRKPINLGKQIDFPAELLKPEIFVPPATGAIYLGIKVAKAELGFK